MTNDKLVPVWIRQYVRDQIQQALAAKERATPDAEVRGEVIRRGESMDIRSIETFFERLRHQIDGELEFGICLIGQLKQGLAPAAHFTEQTSSTQDQPTPKQTTTGVGYIDPKICGSFVERTGPPTLEEVDARIEEHFRHRQELRQSQRIGVYDYESCVRCLRTNYKLIFGEDAPLTDPQDMIQRLAAEIQNLRRAFPNDPER